MNNNKIVQVNYRANDPNVKIEYTVDNQDVHPSVEQSLSNAADSFEDDIVLYLDTKSTSQEEKNDWETYFDDIIHGEAQPIASDTVGRDQTDLNLNSQHISSISKVLYNQPEDFARVDAGPVLEPELLENGVNKLAILGSVTPQNENKDHYLGEFHQEDPELSEGVEDRFRFYGMVNEIDLKMTDHIQENADEDHGTIVMRQSPNSQAYWLEENGYDVLEANLQGPTERAKDGIKLDEYEGLLLHKPPK